MSIFAKAMGFVAVCLILGLVAKFTPLKPIKIGTPEVAQIPGTIIPNHSTVVDDLLKLYQARPLFTSKSVNRDETTDIIQPDIAEDWSPLDYHLIGISRITSKTTGWFKNVETGALVSGRQGMQLGHWTLEYLSSAEAKLSSGDKTENLKLFQGEEPR